MPRMCARLYLSHGVLPREDAGSCHSQLQSCFGGHPGRPSFHKLWGARKGAHAHDAIHVHPGLRWRISFSGSRPGGWKVIYLSALHHGHTLEALTNQGAVGTA